MNPELLNVATFVLAVKPTTLPDLFAVTISHIKCTDDIIVLLLSSGGSSYLLEGSKICFAV